MATGTKSRRASLPSINGAIVSGAFVTATNLETNQKRSANSDAEGRYRFGYLPVGTYKVTVESQGFAPLDRQITLTVAKPSICRSNSMS